MYDNSEEKRKVIAHLLKINYSDIISEDMQLAILSFIVQFGFAQAFNPFETILGLNYEFISTNAKIEELVHPSAK